MRRRTPACDAPGDRRRRARRLLADERAPCGTGLLPHCRSDDIDGTPQPDSRLLIRCTGCGHERLRGEARPDAAQPEPARSDPARPAVRTIDSLHASFPSAADVRLDVRERVLLLQSEFLVERPELDPGVGAYRRRYAALLTREGLPGATPGQLLHFANSTTVADPTDLIWRLAVWSNHLLRSPVGDDIPDLQHAARFLHRARSSR